MRCPCGADHTLPGRKRPASRVADPVDVHLASQEFRRIRAMIEPEGVADECHQGTHRHGGDRPTARVLYTENGREFVTADMCDRHAAQTRRRFIREGRRGVEIMPAGWTPPVEAVEWVGSRMDMDLAMVGGTSAVVHVPPGWGSSDMADAFVQQAGGRSWVVPDVNAFLANTYQPEAEAAHRFLMQERALMTPVPVPGDPRRNR